jgi:transglutaminase-like putative cysteine protease
MGGVLITYQEEEERAKRFLSEASLNKKDLIFDFSLIKTQISLLCPRETTFLEVALEGVLERLPILQGPGQEAFEQKRKGTNSAVYRLHFDRTSPPKAVGGPLDKADLHQYLVATVHLESNHPEIIKKAAEVTAGAASPMECVQRLTSWVSEEVKDEAVESFSALEVLHTRTGECQAHTMLYAAMARAEGIPTRIVGGIVYAAGLGFLYHSWAESYLDGWIAVDPTFNQVGVDATHIKLVEGPSWTSLIPLGKVVGRIKATIIDFRAPCRTSSRPGFLARRILEGHF